MASRAEHRVAFERLKALLHTAAATSARALRAHRGTPAGDAVERQLEHTLDRLALLHGRDTYENISTAHIFETAIDGERTLARELEAAEAAAAAARARSLVDAARRAVRVRVRANGTPDAPYRGVYVEPLRSELERLLWHRREPYVRWRDGAVIVLREPELDELRAVGDEVDVLFLDVDELLDVDAADDPPAMDAELDRRLTAARGAPDRVGDSRTRYERRMLLHQSTVLRNLRDRLAGDHPAAHAALLPILAEHRELLQTSLAAAPPERGAPEDPLDAAIEAERELQTLVTRWAAEADDPAGLRHRFQAVAEVGTHLPELESHRS